MAIIVVVRIALESLLVFAAISTINSISHLVNLAIAARLFIGSVPWFMILSFLKSRKFTNFSTHNLVLGQFEIVIIRPGPYYSNCGLGLLQQIIVVPLVHLYHRQELPEILVRGICI